MEVLNAAKELGQAGTVVILLAMLGFAGLALRALWESYRTFAERAIAALEANAAAMEEHNQAVKEYSKALQTSAAATEGITSLVTSLVNRGIPK